MRLQQTRGASLLNRIVRTGHIITQKIFTKIVCVDMRKMTGLSKIILNIP
jgi:hypothetical protein